LKPLVQKRHIREYSGKRLGVDAMCWMHKGAFACSQELVEGKDTDKFIHFFIRMCEVLRVHKVKPVIVFDGARLPAKAKEEQSRTDNREKARKEAMEMLERRNNGEYVDERVLSSTCGTAIKVTGQMIARLQSALTELGIQYVVSPYEADAQLAYMCRVGIVHAVISEDSDLLAYGCPSTFYKMDKYGDGDSIELDFLQKRHEKPTGDEQSHLDQELEDEIDDPEAAAALAQAEEVVGGAEEPVVKTLKGRRAAAGRGRGQGRGRGRVKAQTGKALTDVAVADVEEASTVPVENFVHAAVARTKDAVKNELELQQLAKLNRWSPEKFTELCVLCGTDYKEFDVKIKGFGVKTAFRFMCQFRNVSRMISWMQKDKKWKDRMPCEADEFMQRFNKVIVVFWHHVVFNPLECKCASISSAFHGSARVVPDLEVEAYCGTFIPQELAMQASQGKVDPRSLKPRQLLPLTPAERATLDWILSKKKGELHNFEAEHRRKEEAKAIAAVRELAEAAAARKAAGTHTSTQEPVAPTPATTPAAETPGGIDENMAQNIDAAAIDEDVPPAPKPFNLLQADLSALLKLTGSVPKLGIKRRRDGEAESTESPEKAAASSAPSNPFSRKNANPFSRQNRNDTSQDDESSIVVTKRPRLVPTANRAAIGLTSASTKSSASGIAKPERLYVEQKLHPKGGYAAEEAAKAVLFRRGIREYEKIPEEQDRSKIGSFFRPTSGDKKAASFHKNTVEKTDVDRKKVSNWKSRPWEASQEEAEGRVNQFNPLSLESARNPQRAFRKSAHGMS